MQYNVIVVGPDSCGVKNKIEDLNIEGLKVISAIDNPGDLPGHLAVHEADAVLTTGEVIEQDVSMLSVKGLPIDGLEIALRNCVASKKKNEQLKVSLKMHSITRCLYEGEMQYDEILQGNPAFAVAMTNGMPKYLAMLKWNKRESILKDSPYTTSYKIAEYINGLHGGAEYYATITDETEIPVVISAKNEEFDVLDELMFLQSMIKSAWGIEILAGVSEAFEDFDMLVRNFEKCRNVTAESIAAKGNRIMFCEELEQTDDFDKIDLKMLKADVERFLLVFTLQQAEKFIDKYFNETRGSAYIRSVLFNAVVFLESALNESGLSLGHVAELPVIYAKIMKFNNIEDVRNWCINILKTANEIVSANRRDHSTIVEKVLKIVHGKYGEHLTMQSIADEVFFSKRHVHRVFVDEIGISVLDYLTNYRIEKSKKLLEETTIKIGDVAKTVGYTNKSYFCNVFEKVVGTTPFAYRIDFKKAKESERKTVMK